MLNIAFCDDDRKFLSRIVPKTESIFRHYRTDVCSYTFDDGDDLIKAFSKYNPYYDVIFLDIELPGKNGKEIARELRNIN